MNTTLLEELMQLDPAERLDIAIKLWESVHPPGSAFPGEVVEVPEQQLAEAERRLAEHERDPSSAIPWEEVKARLWARFK